MAATLLGCASQDGLCPSNCSPEGFIPNEKDIAPSDKAALAPDVTALASLQTPEPAPPAHAAQRYWVLEAADVQCRAAASAALANAMCHESQLLGQLGAENADAEAVRCQILAYAALDERNRAAAQALEVFYLLAEAEANRDILRRGVERADAMLNDLADLEKQGLTVPPDADSIRRQRLDLLDRQAQLELSLRQLNSQLRQLLGVESSELAPFWPAADLRVVPEPIDYEVAVADGLAHRADVNLLRMLSQALSTRTVEAVRAGLSQISGVLGISVPAARRLSAWLGGAAKRTEVHARRRQLEGLLADRHRAAGEEIRQAAQTVETRLDQVLLAQSKVENWEKHVDSLKQLQGGPDGVTAFDLGAAELQLLEARSTLVHEVVAWRIAQVKLKQSQGLLSLECGYELPPLPCSGE